MSRQLYAVVRQSFGESVDTVAAALSLVTLKPGRDPHAAALLAILHETLDVALKAGPTTARALIEALLRAVAEPGAEAPDAIFAAQDAFVVEATQVIAATAERAARKGRAADA